MANPKYIDESYLPDAAADGSSKKVTKKAYSFRCDETLLEDMTTYADKEGITLPHLLSNIMADFLADKTLTNTYLPEYEGQYISIPSNVKNTDKLFEYELRYVMNNLDVWDSRYGYVSKKAANNKVKSVRRPDEIIHEGIDFLIIPETLHGRKLPNRERQMLHITHVLNLNDIPSCLYCIYITVDRTGLIRYEVISWIKAMNKLKAVERYDIISHANHIKKKLEKLHQEWISYRDICDEEEMMWQGAYGRLLKMAETYNTGAILPADKSIDNIEYAPIVETLPDNYDLINKLMKENKRLKKMEDDFMNIKAKVDEIESREYSDEEIMEHISEGRVDDLPESDDD